MKLSCDKAACYDDGGADLYCSEQNHEEEVIERRLKHGTIER
jgi:hypothetical protein